MPVARRAAPPFSGPEGPANSAPPQGLNRVAPGPDQFAVAEARSTLTPGPMVEDTDTFFR